MADRRRVSLVGEARNVAVRLHDVAEPGQVLITAATRRLIRGHFEGTSLGRRKIKGVTQPVEEIAEFGLLLFEPAQGVHTVFVEGAIAGRGRTEGEAAAFHPATHPLHFVLHPLHLVLPAIHVIPATHRRAPECEKEKGKADRPPEKETKNGRNHHSRMNAHPRAVVGFINRAAPSIDICGVGHFPLHDGHWAV